MPNCDFYGLGRDHVGLLEFVFEQPGWLMVELASEPDRELREFHALPDLLAAFPALEAQRTGFHFQLYCESMRGGIRRRRIDFKPGAVPGASFRYDSEGWGLIQVYFGVLRGKRLSPSHTNHNSERRATRWEPTYADRLGPIADWQWSEVTRISARLNRFIRSESVGKEGSRPILAAAFQARAAGDVELATV